MDRVFFKILLWLMAYLFSRGSPLAMLRHATSSQSFIFHQAKVDPTPPTTSTQSPRYTGSQTQPKYEYKYEVSDHETGDRKSHWESREGDRVRGSYTLYEPDGVLRTVEYSADAVHGFNAVVKRNEPSKHQLRTPHSSFKEGFSSNGVSKSLGASDGHYKYLPEDKGLIEGKGGDDGRYSGVNDRTEVGFRVDHIVG